ncbi:MAG TPA: hypothetical protein VN081_03670 [Dongiaceae bacterium]|nr:hypothetical protein [Dongiaceae bacterium]
MTLVDKELTLKNVEHANNSPEFASRREREKKLVPLDPEAFNDYREGAIPIEQIYLNQFGEEFELRVRCEYRPEGPLYTSTLKQKSEELVDGVVDSLEIETEISKEAYHFYADNPRFPVLKQLRNRVSNALSIDFIEGQDLPIIEVETHDAVERAAILALLEGKVEDRSGDKTLNKSYIAHEQNGFERPYSPESLGVFAKRIAKEMVARYVTGKNQVVAGLTGMSGSGKTTVTRAIQEEITALFGTEFTPLVVSTDDYHFGKTKLETTYGAPWTAWDDPRTYNTAELAFDLERLAEGYPLIKRHFNFETEEPEFDDESALSPFVIVEGLYAGSKDLAAVRDLHFELPTGIATSVGRDVRRLIIENRANRVFPTPESRLKYQVETAMPLYLNRERPGRNSFSASVRPLAERAFMLEHLS